MPPRTLPLARALLAALPLVAACGGGGDGPSTPSGGGATVASVNVSLASATLDAGATTQAQATPMDASGRAVSGRAATWSSNAASVATVDAGSGLVTARGAGAAQITATVDGRAGSATVTVRATPQAAALVSMLPASYVPAFVTIKVGQSVAWDFTGSLDHNVIFQQRAGAPADITPRRSGTVTRRFDTAGTFPYACTLHAGMVGEVAVER